MKILQLTNAISRAGAEWNVGEWVVLLVVGFYVETKWVETKWIGEYFGITAEVEGGNINAGILRNCHVLENQILGSFSAKEWNRRIQAQSFFNHQLEIAQTVQFLHGNWRREVITECSPKFLKNFLLNLRILCEVVENEGDTTCCRVVSLQGIKFIISCKTTSNYVTSNMKVSTSSRMSSLLSG